MTGNRHRKYRPATLGDLANYVSLLEEIGGRPFKKTSQRGYVGHALHRTDRNPSLSVFIGNGGGIVVYDFARRESWSYYTYLQELGREDLAKAWLKLFEEWDPTAEGNQGGEPKSAPEKMAVPKLPKGEVRYPTIQPATDEWEAEARAAMEAAREAVLNGEHPKTLRYMEERGLTPEYAYAAGLGAVEAGIAIPLYDEDLRLKSVKVRRWDGVKGDKDKPRFVALFTDRGNGYYFSPDFAWKPMERVVIVEGEMNAAAVYLALDLPTIGLPGAGTGLSRKLVELLKEHASEVVVLGDQDDAGRRLIDNVITQLVEAGYDRSHIYIPAEEQFHRDPMDILAAYGLDGLRERLTKRIFNRGRSLKRGTSNVKQGIAKEAYQNEDGLNTKRALLNATGQSVIRRHASYIPPEHNEAVVNLVDFLTERAMGEGVDPVLARKSARKWMDENKITPNAALFIVLEANGINTGSKELKDKHAYFRKQHALIAKYRHRDEKGRVHFDIRRLLEDAVRQIIKMTEEVAGFFQRIAERVKKERERFATWMADLPHLLKRIVRRDVEVGAVTAKCDTAEGEVAGGKAVVADRPAIPSPVVAVSIRPMPALPTAVAVT